MGLADAIRNVVTSVVGLDGVGMASVLIRRTEDYDPESTAGSSNKHTVRHPVKLSTPEMFKRLAAGGAQETKTRLLLIPRDWALIPEPKTDTVLIGNEEMNFSEVGKIMSGDKVVAFELVLGK